MEKTIPDWNSTISKQRNRNTSQALAEMTESGQNAPIRLALGDCAPTKGIGRKRTK